MSNLTFSGLEPQLYQLYQSGENAQALDLATREASRFPTQAWRVIYWRICMASLLGEMTA